jgi:mycothiol synthase
VIDHDWHAEVDGDTRDELRRLLADAAEADAEAGFPSFGLDDLVPDGTRYLLIWLLPDDRSGHDEQPPTLAGCLRLEPSGGTTAEVRMVIHPEYRSRGITTLLCERLGLDTSSDGTAAGGWAGTGAAELRCWARGNHPAAQRVALRFAGAGLRRARREWCLVVPLARGVDLENPSGVREVPADVADELLGRADEPGFDVESVLEKALAELRDAGARVGSLTVDDRQRTLLAACRALGFQHDRTDCEYVLG